jgi:prephenate dehydrogenase
MGRLTVLGLGQLGGSFALAARASGCTTEIVGFGRSEASLAEARRLGLADRTCTDPRDAVRGAQTVLIAIPLRSVSTVVASIRDALEPGTLVMDVGSVKGTAVRDIEGPLFGAAASSSGVGAGALAPSAAPAGASVPAVAFVACHPLAGTERFGPAAASAELYRGRRCILCPSARTSAHALERARRAWTAVGAEVILMPAALHDETMAAVSHLPHVAAYALARVLGELSAEVTASALALPTTSLRDTTRIAASSPAMWRDIFLENREALLPMVARLEEAVASLRSAISADDSGALEAFLEGARATRDRLFPR